MKNIRSIRSCLVAAAALTPLALAGPVSAQVIGGSDGGSLECEERMAEIQDLIREKDMEIPSGALNDIFTLQQQATEACGGGSDQLSLQLLDDLEETVLAAVDEGIPSVTPEDADAGFAADAETTGSTITESMTEIGEDDSGEEGDNGGFVRETEGWEPPEGLDDEIESELQDDPAPTN
jgi:hypothetical protein